MNCWRVGNLIAPFIDDELPDAESDAVATHLEQCDACAESVEAVASLPEFERVAVDPKVEKSLFAEFDRCLAERIRQSLVPAEDEAAELAPTGTFGGLIRREVRVPVALVAAYAGVALMLGGGIILNYQRVADLQIAVGERDAIIDSMRVRLAAAERGDDDFTLVSRDAALDEQPNVVFFPSGVTTTGLPAAAAQPVMPASFQLGPAESPRVVQ